MTQEEILKVNNLFVRFYTYEGVVEALDDVNLTIKKGEILGLVGETGCGKSVTSLSTLRLVPPPGVIEKGEVHLRKEDRFVDLLKQPEPFIRQIRGKDIAMIFQEPRAYLNPVYSVYDQISEVLLVHRKKEFLEKALTSLKEKNRQYIFDCNSLNKDCNFKIKAKEKTKLFNIAVQHLKDAHKWNVTKSDLQSKIEQAIREDVAWTFEMKLYKRMIEKPNSLITRFLSKIYRSKRELKNELRKEVVRLLKVMGIPDPERVADMYPHELSGGMAQRVVIAMAISCNPLILIADEPTTNLDVTVQAQILTLVKDLRDKFGSSILYITHDLGVIAEVCDRVGVMYAGTIVELADIMELFTRPLHPYTVGLLESIPRPGKELKSIPGTVPSLINPPSGCRFHNRCAYAMDICTRVKPPFREVKENHYVACHLYGGSK